MQYLEAAIVESKQTEAPRYGMTVDGYTKRSGAPTSWLVRLEGEKRFRRVMAWCFSNCGTLFIRVGGAPLIIRDEFAITEAVS
jgi:hypothetical protein